MGGYSDETAEYSVIATNDGVCFSTDNAFIERFFRKLKYEKLYQEHPGTVVELNQVCSQFIHYYKEKRDHSSIGNIPTVKAYRRAA